MISIIKNRNLAFKIIATSLIISLAIIVVIEAKAQKDIWVLLEEKDYEVTEKILETVTRQFDDNYRLMTLVLAQITANDDIVTTFAERDRKKLIELTSPLYNSMKKDGILQYHFHLPDNTTFLRVHNLEMYGDDLTELRPMLVKANKLQNPIEGLEEGVHGVSFRSIQPVYHQGNFIGSIELGMVLDVENLKSLKRIFGGEWYLCALRDVKMEHVLSYNEVCPLDISPDTLVEIKNGRLNSLTQGTMQTQVIVLQDYTKDIKWILARVFDNTDIVNTRREQSFSTMLSAFSLVGLGLLLMSLLLKRLLNPLSYLVGITKSFTDGDFENEIMITRKDEIGQLALSMENMRKSIRDKEAQLKYQSMHDHLTGLYNRAYFENVVEKHRNGNTYPISFITADMDGLKLINDTMGHKTGDKLLKDCALTLKSPLREQDILARIGGDEFAIILFNTSEEQANNTVSTLCSAVEQFNRSHPHLPISVSLGVATSLGPEDSLDETFKVADSRMYKDKLYRSASARGQIVNALLAALSERDYVAEGHADRLTDLCKKVGGEIGLPSTQISDLILLAKVHDLGKVGIPDHILFKPGKLTESEWEIMRQHPEKGFRIAQSSPDLASVARLILHHHESWDGTGYPQNLKGDEIPVECRILAIVDAYDAMTNERPYSRAKTKEEALAEIKRCAGGQFDPHLTEIFFKIV